jgi:hypothetical protein
MLFGSGARPSGHLHLNIRKYQPTVCKFPWNYSEIASRPAQACAYRLRLYLIQGGELLGALVELLSLVTFHLLVILLENLRRFPCGIARLINAGRQKHIAY